VSMSDLSTLTAVGNKVNTKIQNCVWDRSIKEAAEWS